ncbi:tetratricopeptide (TPR) repeat protein [Catenulispora sp. EB89]|uniref:ATP-binding protein n=1 Tax=Catenulispora sp. EB89 TaxID=3156257 RepID=UPI003512C8EA
MSGTASDVVQARDVSGGIHFHQSEGASLPIPRQLPAGIRDFTGRTTDLLALDALIPTEASDVAVGRPGAVVISAIEGAAGIGKTTLAIHWAHQVRHRFPDGTLYANLRGYGPGQPAAASEVLDGFLRALGVPPGRIPAALDEQAGLYRSLLDARRVLVVLDNASSPEQIRLLLPAGAGCLALITSRSTMTGLIVAQGATRISLDLLPFDEAVVMLRGIVGDQRADAEPQALSDIVHACARLPLALRIAGARAIARPRTPLANLRGALLDQRRRLDTLSMTGDEATAVRAVFAWSYHALPSGQARLFRSLGLHPGIEIDVYAAAALVGSSTDGVHEGLEALADVHLIEPASPDRYELHDLLRAYGLEQAEREDAQANRADALSRLLGFYLHAADAADRTVMIRMRASTDSVPAPRYLPTFDTALTAMEWFEREYANLTAASRCAAEEGLHALAWQLPAALNGLFDYAGRCTDWLAACESALSAARVLGDRRAEQYTLCSLVGVLRELHRPEEAVETAEAALDIAGQNRDRFGELLALHVNGEAYQSAKRFDDAADSHRRALEVSRELADPWSEAIALYRLGLMHQELGHLDEALDCHQKAREIFRKVGDHAREGWVLCGLGDVYLALDRLDLAAVQHCKALDIARRLGYPRLRAEALDGLGRNLHHAGNFQGAREHWLQAMEIFEQLGSPRADDVHTHLQA